MKSYDQYCPMALACKIVGERWTPLVPRELVCGRSRFNEIHRGVPRISPSLLARRRAVRAEPNTSCAPPAPTTFCLLE